MILALSLQSVLLHEANASFAALTAFLASSPVPFWKCPMMISESMGDLVENSSFEKMPFSPMNMG